MFEVQQVTLAINATQSFDFRIRPDNFIVLVDPESIGGIVNVVLAPQMSAGMSSAKLAPGMRASLPAASPYISVQNIGNAPAAVTVVASAVEKASQLPFDVSQYSPQGNFYTDLDLFDGTGLSAGFNINVPDFPGARTLFWSVQVANVVGSPTVTTYLLKQGFTLNNIVTYENVGIMAIFSGNGITSGVFTGAIHNLQISVSILTGITSFDLHVAGRIY